MQRCIPAGKVCGVNAIGEDKRSPFYVPLNMADEVVEDMFWTAGPERSGP